MIQVNLFDYLLKTIWIQLLYLSGCMCVSLYFPKGSTERALIGVSLSCSSHRNGKWGMCLSKTIFMNTDVCVKVSLGYFSWRRCFYVLLPLCQTIFISNQGKAKITGSEKQHIPENLFSKIYYGMKPSLPNIYLRVSRTYGTNRICNQQNLLANKRAREDN